MITTSYLTLRIRRFLTWTSWCVLTLNNNLLSALPDFIFQNTKLLTVLDMSNNSLQTVPTSVMELSQLTLLLLNDNKLTRLPLTGNSSMILNKLSVLELSRNNFTSIEVDSFSQFPNLQTLALEDCNLRHIAPTCFCQNRLLANLILSNNPDLDFNLHKYYFCLGENVHMLQLLGLRNIGLTTIDGAFPASLLFHSSYLFLDGNHIEDLPEQTQLV